MTIPFTTEEFIAVFRDYNTAIWPMQVVAYILGIFIVAATFTRRPPADRTASGMLAFLWAWTGAVYHIGHFSTLNPPARVFGGLFIIEAALLIWYGAVRHGIKFGTGGGAAYMTGWLFIVYSMLIYPLIGHVAGHAYPASPTFGITPCPLTIFTFGMLLLTGERVPRPVIVIPFIWSLIGAMAAFKLGIREDIGLLVAGIGGTIIITFRDRKKKGLA